MKFLALGDFHGKFPAKLRNIAKSKEIDSIIFLGDSANADKIRKMIFKNWTDKPWYEIVGMKKARQLEKESFNSGLKILKILNSFNKPVYLIWGNTDFYKDYTTSEPPVIMPGFYDKEIRKMKNIILTDRKDRKLNNLEIIGYGGYLDVTEFINHPIDKDKEKQKRRLKRYMNDTRKLRELFLKYKPGKNFIFLTHYTPYGIFDKVNFKQSPMHGKHVGWLPYNDVIKKYHPLLVLCGHMHEYQGAKKLGKTTIINPGPASNGKAAVIEINDETKGIEKIRFVK
jgi:Icc-related predicted phosphoesterase